MQVCMTAHRRFRSRSRNGNNTVLINYFTCWSWHWREKMGKGGDARLGLRACLCISILCWAMLSSSCAVHRQTPKSLANARATLVLSSLGRTDLARIFWSSQARWQELLGQGHMSCHWMFELAAVWQDSSGKLRAWTWSIMLVFSRHGTTFSSLSPPDRALLFFLDITAPQEKPPKFKPLVFFQECRVCSCRLCKCAAQLGCWGFRSTTGAGNAAVAHGQSRFWRDLQPRCDLWH